MTQNMQLKNELQEKVDLYTNMLGVQFNLDPAFVECMYDYFFEFEKDKLFKVIPLPMYDNTLLFCICIGDVDEFIDTKDIQQKWKEGEDLKSLARSKRSELLDRAAKIVLANMRNQVETKNPS